jgi:hypothetical protein
MIKNVGLNSGVQANMPSVLRSRFLDSLAVLIYMHDKDFSVVTSNSITAVAILPTDHGHIVS